MHKVYSGQSCTVCNTEEEYRALCAKYREVNAAGGLVSDGRGKLLLIRRSGKWDLPKGHQEKGEDILLTALREVREETGVQAEGGELICITDHCYLRDSVWHLKHTWWYKMTCPGGAQTLPQTEEDITEAVWVKEEDLPPLLDDTYPSIREVFEKAHIG